eukprot:g73507.t1
MCKRCCCKAWADDGQEDNMQKRCQQTSFVINCVLMLFVALALIPLQWVKTDELGEFHAGLTRYSIYGDSHPLTDPGPAESAFNKIGVDVAQFLGNIDNAGTTLLTVCLIVTILLLISQIFTLALALEKFPYKQTKPQAIAIGFALTAAVVLFFGMVAYVAILPTWPTTCEGVDKCGFAYGPSFRVFAIGCLGLPFSAVLLMCSLRMPTPLDDVMDSARSAGRRLSGRSGRVTEPCGESTDYESETVTRGLKSPSPIVAAGGGAVTDRLGRKPPCRTESSDRRGHSPAAREKPGAAVTGQWPAPTVQNTATERRLRLSGPGQAELTVEQSQLMHVYQ